MNAELPQLLLALAEAQATGRIEARINGELATLRIHDGMIIAASNPSGDRNTLPQLSPDAERAELQRIVEDLLELPCSGAEFKATQESQSRGVAVNPRDVLAAMVNKKKVVNPDDAELKNSVVRRSRASSNERQDTSYSLRPPTTVEQPFKRGRSSSR